MKLINENKILIRLLIQEEESTLFKIHQQVANIPIKKFLKLVTLLT